MDVDVIIEQRFYQCSAGELWTENAFPYIFWTRYLSVFSGVNIVARVQGVSKAKQGWKRVDGKHVGFTALPCYIGPIGFVKTLPKLVKALRCIKSNHRAVIYRVPGILSCLYHYLSLPKGQKYAAEVVGDPEDVFAVGASKSILRPVFKWLFVNMLKKQCHHATSISYVTEYSLQQRYPPAKQAFNTHYSSIQLTDEDYKTRSNYQLGAPLQIICIGNLTQPYKGCDFMLQTLAQLKEQDVACQLTWIGGGYLLDSMQTLAHELDIAGNVTFLGNLSDRKTIRQEIDNADVFVLSSRQEGLPRVMIESMARSLVCIATNVGGVKELVPDQFIIQRDNTSELVAAIKGLQVMTEQQLLANSKQNFSKAMEYENAALAKRRTDMYQHLAKASL